MAKPKFQIISPHPGTENFPPDAALKVEVTEEVTGIDAASVVIKVNDVVAWSGDAQQPGFTVTKYIITDAMYNGFGYDIVPDSDLEYGTQPLYVYAEQAAPGTDVLEEMFYFSVGVPVLPAESGPTDQGGVEPDSIEIFNSGAVSLPSTLLGYERAGPGIYHGNDFIEAVRPTAGLDDFVIMSLIAPPGTVRERAVGFEELLYFALEPEAGFDINTYDWGEVTPDGSRPRLIMASGSGHTVRVTFDRAMRDHPYLGGVLEPDNYFISETPVGARYRVMQVKRVGSTQVDLITEEFIPQTRNYRLQVKNVQDADGDTIDPSYNETTFTAAGTAWTLETDLYAFYGQYGGMDANIEIGVPPDVEPPYLDNQNPAPLEIDVIPGKTIYFEVLDNAGGKGMDPDTIQIWVEGNLAYDGFTNTFQAGYDGVGSARYVIGNGYGFNIDKVGVYDQYQWVTVRCYGEDLAAIANIIDETWQFRIEDTTDPTFTNFDPPQGATDQAADCDISFSVEDIGSGVDWFTVNVTIEAVPAIINGVIQPEFSGPNTSVLPNGANGYDVVLDRTVNHSSASPVLVYVNAKDNEANEGSDSWTFGVEDWQGPIVTPISPTNNELEVPLDTSVTVDIEDDSGIIVAGFTVEIDRGDGWELAYENGGSPAFKVGFDGPGSSIISLPDGYRVVIDPVDDFGPAETIYVRVTAEDPTGNPSEIA